MLERESSPSPDVGPSPVLAPLPEIPLDLDFDLSEILGTPDVEYVQNIPDICDPCLTCVFYSTAKVQKRASNVQKLAEENEKLKEQLKAMSDRLEAAERKRQELAHKEQNLMEPPTS